MTSKKLCLAAAISLTACASWVVLKHTAEGDLSVGNTLSLRRLRSGKPYRRLQNRSDRKAKQERRKKQRQQNRQENNGDSDQSSGGGSSNLAPPIADHDMWMLNSGGGVSIKVLNNLAPGSEWNGYLNTVFNDWNNDIPGGMSLQLRTVSSFEPGCPPEAWVIKVCNDNYGQTAWKGVNQIFIREGLIIASTAKMNDYYAPDMDSDEKRYVLCHEMGHGLGLRHSDEDFFNADTGDCMDYTTRHWNNSRPGWVNFKALQQMYGDGSENVRRLNVPSGMAVADEITLSFQEEFEAFAANAAEPLELPSNSEGGHSGWRMLHKSETAEVHEMELGNGYSVRNVFLLA